MVFSYIKWLLLLESVAVFWVPIGPIMLQFYRKRKGLPRYRQSFQRVLSALSQECLLSRLMSDVDEEEDWISCLTERIAPRTF
jgi:hypothetical protein